MSVRERERERERGREGERDLYEAGARNSRNQKIVVFKSKLSTCLESTEDRNCDVTAHLCLIVILQKNKRVPNVPLDKCAQLTLLMLNKLRCHAHFKFPARLLDPGFS